MTNETTSDSLSVQLVQTFRGHTSDVNTVLFSSREGRSPLLASCSSDKTIRLWNLDEQSSKTLTRHTYQVHCLAFAAPAEQTSVQYMASVSTDGTCLLWDSKTNSVLKEYRHESGSPIRVCQFSPDGLLLATAGDDELINLWDITAASSRPVKIFTGHSASIVALQFFSDLLVSGSFYGDLKLWLTDSSFTGHFHFEREAHDLGVTCIDVLRPSSSQTAILASGGNDNEVKIWSCSSNSKPPLLHQRTLKKHSCAVMCVAFGLDPYLASGSGDKTIVLWNFRTGQSILQFEAHSRYVTCCAFSPDGEFLASGSNDRLVNLWRLTSAEKPSSEQTRCQLTPIEEWTSEMVEEWAKKHRLTLAVQLTGNDLLAKSDHEISELFHYNEDLLQKFSVLRHANFLRRLSSSLSTSVVIPNEYLCPITHEPMRDPVCVADGYTYERRAIEAWLAKRQSSPMSNCPITGTQLYPNKILKMLIEQYLQQR